MPMVAELLVKMYIQPECESSACDKCSHIPPIEGLAAAPLLLKFIRDGAEHRANTDSAPLRDRSSARMAKQKRYADEAEGERKTR